MSHHIHKKLGDEKRKEHTCMSVRVSHTHAAAGKGSGEEEEGESHKCWWSSRYVSVVHWVGGRQREGTESKDIIKCMHEVSMRAKKKDNQSITSSTPHQEEQIQVKRHTQHRVVSFQVKKRTPTNVRSKLLKTSSI